MNGKQLAVYETMKDFINAKHYANKEVTQEILRSFNISQDITPDQYTELTLLNKQVYEPVVEVPPATLEEPMIEDTSTEEVPVVAKAKRAK